MEYPQRPPQEPLVPPGGMDLHARDMTGTFSADLPLGHVEEDLEKSGLWLAVDGDEGRTLGELVEANSTGPLRLGFGGWRDLLLGVQFINGRGELITAGGKTVKNVAGYDLTKFMVGQRGVFGKLVTLTTRIHRRPEDAMRVEFPADPRGLLALMPTACRPQWAVLTAKNLVCGYLGEKQAIDFYASAVGAYQPMKIVRDGFAADVMYRREHWAVPSGLSFRAAVAPARIPEFVGKIGSSDWVADAAFGIVIGPLGSGEGIAAIREAAKSLGGSAYLIDGDAGVVDAECNPATAQVLHLLKQAFDAEGRLAPLPPSA